MDTKEITLYRAVTIAAVVLMSIIFYFIISSLRQQRKQRISYKEKIEGEITTLENERTRVAADLHDELGPILSAAKFKLFSIDSTDPENRKCIADASRHIDTILEKVRFISNGLMPNTLITKGTVYAIEEFIDNLGDNIGLSIQFRQYDVPNLQHQQSIHIYRMLQEIIHNSIKHASASRLVIEMRATKNRLLLLSADDGKGFNAIDAIKGKKGLGLRNLQSRADILNGNINIVSKTGKGTRISIEIPLT